MTTMVASTLKDRVSAKQLPALYHTDCSVKSFASLNGIAAAAVFNTTLNISSLVDTTAGNYVFIHAAPFAVFSAPSGACHHTANYWMLMSPAPTSPINVNTITNRLVTLGSYNDCDLASFSAVGRLA